MKDLHYLFWKASGMNGVKSMQRYASVQNTETCKVANVSNQEEDNGLHILKTLQVLVDRTLMESRDSTSYVHLLQKIVKVIDYHNTMKMQSNEAITMTATLVAKKLYLMCYHYNQRPARGYTVHNPYIVMSFSMVECNYAALHRKYRPMVT